MTPFSGSLYSTDVVEGLVGDRLKNIVLHTRSTAYKIENQQEPTV